MPCCVDLAGNISGYITGFNTEFDHACWSHMHWPGMCHPLTNTYICAVALWFYGFTSSKWDICMFARRVIRCESRNALNSILRCIVWDALMFCDSYSLTGRDCVGHLWAMSTIMLSWPGTTKYSLIFPAEHRQMDYEGCAEVFTISFFTMPTLGVLSDAHFNTCCQAPCTKVLMSLLVRPRHWVGLLDSTFPSLSAGWVEIACSLWYWLIQSATVLTSCSVLKAKTLHTT